MATKTGSSVATPYGGTLTLKGVAVLDWCGYCGCTATTTGAYSIGLGTVGAGTYTLTAQPHASCNINVGGQTAVVCAVSGTSFNQLSGAAAVQWQPGTPYLELIENAPPPIDPNEQFDCLNGGCVPKSTYNTPGKYANLAACEAGCAKDSTCTGECVSAAELAALQQAASNLQSRICG